MAQRIQSYCTFPSCGTKVAAGVTRCRAHDRIRGRRLQQIRRTLFEQQPFCMLCGIRLAVIRDHIQPFGVGGSEEESNTRALCAQCHDIRHQQESRCR